jgi:hypothetical protein
MAEHELHERAAGLVQPDTLLATQYFDRIRRRKDFTGEQRLMYAIIEDAVDVYLKHATARHRHHQQLFVEAELWFESTDHSWIYAFETICDYLGLDAGHLRRGLHAWKARVRGEARPAVAVASAAPPEHRRASNG